MADQQPSGRARGRSRGRGRASSGQQPAQTRRPGETAPAPPRMPPAEPDPLPTPGRGRSRGGSSQVPGSGAPVPAEPRAPPTSQMAALSMSAAGEGGAGGISGRSRQAQLSYAEPKTRPEHIKDKRGTAGNKINIMTNCFKLKADERWLLYQYHVDFSPMVDSPRARQGLLRFHTEALGSPMAFDGMILFLLRRLDQPVTKFETKRRDTDAIVTITITLTNELAPTSPTCIQVYNIIFRKILGFVGMQQIGRHYFNPNDPTVVPQHNLQLWPGFITSILQYEEEVMLMADVSHKILRTDTVLDILANLFAAKKNRFQDEATRMLVGEIVLTSYNNKTYRVDDIEWEKNPMHTFAKYDGSQITYAQYYKEAYGRDITDMEQPLLISRPKKKDERRGMTGPIHLIPELCMLTGLSDDVRADFHVMKDIAQHTRISPDQRVRTLTTFINSFPRNKEAQDYLNKWQVSFVPEPVKIEARVIKAQDIFQKNAKVTYKPADAEWSREIRGNKLLNTVDLEDWFMMFTSRDQPKAIDFLQSLTRVGPGMGMRVQEPKMHQLRDDRAESFVNCIKQNLTKSTQMLVCILPTNRKDRYDAIKKYCCLEAPVPSQCILARTLNKKQTIMSVATKIAMQINCKMGGELWAVDIPPKKMMVIGIDSYHDSSTRGRSVGGFVATLNDNLTRYYSRCTFQHTGQELIDGLKVCMQAALRKYAEINKTLPDRVIIYRDGVGDGQLPAVVEHELPQIIDTFKTLGTNWNPKCAVIVVKKRINNRFFSVNGGKLNNPPPGTVIDSVVTKPDLYDFFLVSQSVRQGTVTPTSYNVIWDTSGLAPNHIQLLTYKMTHLYFNWPGTIRVPAPCLYAHKLSFLVGQSLHKPPSLDLADRLFFL
ncbi:piwi-like protein 1 [Patiria miniata]|uniref:Piwi-like protein 1 n=1 Tax=Patiria miniata TaxID=46514 RepID=A0A914A6P0_PATMI|nr:piwi-like protein 1 [Patiria miniata]